MRKRKIRKARAYYRAAPLDEWTIIQATVLGVFALAMAGASSLAFLHNHYGIF